MLENRKQNILLLLTAVPFYIVYLSRRRYVHHNFQHFGTYFVIFGKKYVFKFKLLHLVEIDIVRI
jgi:hypothetical protein